MAITASLVKELRERTGSGMMECKKALVETGGDIDAAIELMRKSGQAKAAKKAGRIAAEGIVAISLSTNGGRAALTEVNCETDFVAKDGNFRAFVDAVADRAVNGDAKTTDELISSPLREGLDETVNQAREALVAKIGENVNVRRFTRLEAAGGKLYAYSHGGRIGVLVEVEGGDEALGKDIAMHVAASTPVCVSEDDVPTDVLEKERNIFKAQAAESGKPESIVEKIVAGRVRKYLAEITLLGQPFIKDPDMAVEKLLKDKGAKVLRFQRFEVGEGIEKKTENFADEVMAQVRSD